MAAVIGGTTTGAGSTCDEMVTERLVNREHQGQHHEGGKEKRCKWPLYCFARSEKTNNQKPARSPGGARSGIASCAERCFASCRLCRGCRRDGRRRRDASCPPPIRLTDCRMADFTGHERIRVADAAPKRNASRIADETDPTCRTGRGAGALYR